MQSATKVIHGSFSRGLLGFGGADCVTAWGRAERVPPKGAPGGHAHGSFWEAVKSADRLWQPVKNAMITVTLLMITLHEMRRRGGVHDIEEEGKYFLFGLSSGKLVAKTLHHPHNDFFGMVRPRL